MIEPNLKKKLRHGDQAGFSIVMVMVALALVATGTTYILNVEKNNKVIAAKARSTSFTELERRRVSAFLSNSDVCKLAANFGGQQAIRPSIVSLVSSAAGTSLVTSNVAVIPASNPPQQYNQYYNKILTLTSISTRSVSAGAKGYELDLAYADSTVANQRSSYIGKKLTMIRIPMYMKVDASGNVQDCYALTENNDLDLAITNACSPGTIGTASGKSVLARTLDSKIAECQNGVVLDNTTAPTNPYSACSNTTKFMRGFQVSSATSPATGQSFLFTNSLCYNLTGAATPTNCSSNQSAYQVSGTGLSCQNVGVIRDFDGGSNLCTSGQILFRTGISATTCISVNCGADTFLQSISSGGAYCYPVPTKNCNPSGQYISGFLADGTPTCADLPVLTGSCPANNMGSSIDRSNGTNAGTLNCSAFNVAKSCTAGATIFAYQLTPTSAVCNTW